MNTFRLVVDILMVTIHLLSSCQAQNQKKPNQNMTKKLDQNINSENDVESKNTSTTESRFIKDSTKKDFEVKIEFEKIDKHSEADIDRLQKEFGYNLTEEHQAFLRKYPGLEFKGSKIVDLGENQTIGSGLINRFSSASDLTFALGDEAIMAAFTSIPKHKIGAYCILAFSLTETELFLIGSESKNLNNIYIYSSITDEIVLICNGLENFINNHLLSE